MSIKSNRARKKRHRKIRLKISGTADRPRLNVFRSSKHIYAQLIDDIQGHTLASASTMDKELAGVVSDKTKKEQAEIVGQTVAERSLSLGISTVIFDRGGYRYHGRVKALADSARKAGLKF